MIKVANLQKSFEETPVLKGISTTFEKGITNLIIGRSGSGKTVFLKCLLGLYEHDSGTINFDGLEMDTRVQKNRKEKPPPNQISCLRKAPRQVE